MQQCLINSFNDDFFRRNSNELGQVHVFIGQFHDAIGEGRRKKHGLSFLIMGELAQDIAHVFGETEIQKAVSLIYNNNFDARGFEDALLEIINDSAGSADNYIGTLAQRFSLLVVINTAKDLGQRETGMASKVFGFFIDLESQFPGRGHN